jgi:hypothetical protein
VVQELEVVVLEEAASVVEEADGVQHMQACTLELLEGTCSVESKYDASGKRNPKMNPLHECIGLLPCASSDQSRP